MNATLKGLFFICTMLFAFTGIAQDQKTKDDQIIKDHLAKNKIKASKTASGLYYSITKKGTGENAKKGQVVGMYYFGKFLDGRRFDGNMDESYKPSGNPLSFTLGVGQVVPGWDEGIQLLNPGTRATFYIPSALGYGPGGRGPIPANTIMVFDVELVSAK
jgi:FKBP-type peptidyl-prolyl cis-trans isomerase FkpA